MSWTLAAVVIFGVVIIKGLFILAEGLDRIESKL